MGRLEGRERLLSRALLRLFGLLVCLHSGAACTHAPIWQSGFENGFPGGEWFDFDNGAYAADGAMPAGRSSAWTIVHRSSGEPVFAGDHAYKGWIAGRQKDSHRAYPGLHADIPTPLVNTFLVFLDVDYRRMAPSAWVHLGTWGNRDQERESGLWALHTLSVRDGKLEFAHTSPFHGEYLGQATQPEFPLRRWVRLTVYIHYEGTSGFVQAWQDGAPLLRARVSKLEDNPGSRLRTAHWGMYASPTLDHGVQYNDDIRICPLDAPLTDFSSEPSC